MRDEIGRSREEGIQPFGVNPASPEQHAEYARRLALPFPLLADPGLAISTAYGAVQPRRSAIARSVCLIGHDGAVRYSQAGAPGADLVLEASRG